TPLLEVENYALTYENTLLEDISFTVHAGEKVVLVGPNGTGKTSLLRDIRAGSSAAVHFTQSARPAFFSQLHAEILNDENTICQEFFDLGFETRERVEQLLSRYCFASDGLHRKIAHLSGGEKNLLQLAKLSVSGANLLLLDEPSSHLDTFAQIALEDAILEYKGAVLMISHDFYTVVRCADTILYVDEGSVRRMSKRAFRKMIYKHHFSLETLELEQQRRDLETKIERCLEEGDCAQAQRLCDQLETVIDEMQ
ncbi:MAG: ABC-F family ATP-binding cassette domain-containing protein, partial [Oscillospiraceae bacterium]|nr:ABC-F family ATP-binding cassette domain-containing protein [Oscillospiraceae bacterium]